MLLSSVWPVAVLTFLVSAVPLENGIRSTRVHAFKRADGTVDYNLLRAEILKTRSKYNIAPASEPLTDLVSGGIDVLYYGPTEMGTPAQTIRAYLYCSEYEWN